MKKNNYLFAFLLFAATFAGCSKDDGSVELSKPLIKHDLKVYSIENATGGLDAARAGYIDLYDGDAFTEEAAATRSAKIDLVYKYRVQGGPQYYRAFFNMQIQDDQYKTGFTTLTNCQVYPAGEAANMTAADFNALANADDIDAIFARDKFLTSGNNNYAYVSDQVADKEFNRIFAFIDKNGKKGFFMTDDYTPKQPAGSEAVMTMHIKIQP